jgi:hypothetical protein
MSFLEPRRAGASRRGRGGRIHHLPALLIAGILPAAAAPCEVGLYRPAFAPPDVSGTTVLEAMVIAGGRGAAHGDRAQPLAGPDRSMRLARALPAGPAPGTDLPLRSALVPVEAGRRRWSLAVPVGVDAAAVDLVRSADGVRARLEVGAILTDERTGRIWEMRTASDLRGSDDVGAGGILLYE